MSFVFGLLTGLFFVILFSIFRMATIEDIKEEQENQDEEIEIL